MTKPPEKQLLPCPFCGGAPERFNDGGHGLGNTVIDIRCMNLDCPVRCGTDYGDEWEMVKKWNTRAKPKKGST